MSDTQAVELVRSAAAALNAGDVDGYLSHFDESCLRWVAGAEQPLSLADVAAGIHFLRGEIAGMRLEEEGLFGDETLVCARWRLRGSRVSGSDDPAKPRVVDAESCEVYQLEGGLVVSTWTYGDPAQLMRQLTADTADTADGALR